MSALDHVGFGVSDFARSKAFYVEALKPLGITIVFGGDTWAMRVGMGVRNSGLAVPG